MTIIADLDRTASPRGARTTLASARHTWYADLAASAGGEATAPEPHDLLDSALAACTTLTLELYLRRKDWNVSSLHVEVDRDERKGTDGVVEYTLARTIAIAGALSDEQRGQLLAVANRCPIHRVLEGRIAVRTTLA
ncbi:MAG: OsmC family protein [Rhizobacter sp.]|nr:OsmC family protein [Rhizobacter sp.]